jgi:DNA-binding IclR family transcriptional regulator
LAKGIQSISLGFRILRAITDSEAPAPLKTLAAAADMSPSKARMYLISLIETGLVAQNAHTGLYGLGPYARHFGTRALQRMDGRDAVYESIRSLQQKTQALVLLCNWQESGIIIVAAEEGGEPHPVQWRIGGTASLASTATGAVFLALGPQNAVWKRLAVELKEAGLSQAAQKKRIRELEVRAAEVRQSGIAEADPVVFAAGVTISGFAAIAAPVLDAGKQLSSVLTLIYRTDRPHRKKGELVNQVQQAAMMLKPY